MANVRPGDLVTLSIVGRVREPRPGHEHILTVAYAEPEPGVWATVEVTRPDAVTVSVTAEAPEHWPPQAGDIWRLFEPDQDESDIEHGSVWLASRYRGEDTPYLIESHNINSGWKRADDLREIGRMELAYRAGVKP